MKLIATIFFIFFLQIGLSQTVLGKWKTVDDITGKEKGIVEIYEKNGKFYGKIVEIFIAFCRLVTFFDILELDYP